MRRMITTKQIEEIGKLKYIGVENNTLSISYDTTGNDDFANIKLFYSDTNGEGAIQIPSCVYGSNNSLYLYNSLDEITSVSLDSNGDIDIHSGNNMNLNTPQDLQIESNSTNIKYFTYFNIKDSQNDSLISCDDHKMLELYGSAIGIVTKNIQGAGNGSFKIESRSTDNKVKTSLQVDNTGIIITGLPTTDPHVANALWNDNGILKISTGA